MEAMTTPAVANSERQLKVEQLHSIIFDLRHKLQECKIQVAELNSLQLDFRSRVGRLMRKANGTTPQGKENVPAVTSIVVSPVPRRWNSDLSLEFELNSSMNRFHCDKETVMAPVIRATTASSVQRRAAKFTNRLEVTACKRPSDNLLLSDLGLGTQAPDFSQSECNLSSEEGAAAKASGGGAVRVRFLSHDGGPGGGLKPLDGRSTLEIGEYGHHCERLSQSGSWATLTQSERDLSEVHRADSRSEMADSNASLCQLQNEAPVTSTPYRPYASRTRLRHSVSFNDLLAGSRRAARAAQLGSSWIVGDPIDDDEPLHLQSKRHPMAAVEQPRPHGGSAAAAVVGGAANSSAAAGHTFSGGDNGPYVPSTISALFLGGRVKALHGGHLVVSGTVWYRGRLPGLPEDFIGVEIDQVGLGGDGSYQGHRYFRCAPGRGLFVPFRKIIMAWPPPTSSPSTSSAHQQQPPL